MILGFTTDCLPALALPEVLEIASEDGFGALEITTRPEWDSASGNARHLAAEAMGGREAETLRENLERHSVIPSGLIYHGNNLHPNAETRTLVNTYVMSCADAAAAIGCPVVGVFIGRDPSRTVLENLRAAEVLFPRLVDHAGEKGVVLAVENCLMEGWHPDGYPGNLAYSPELWEWMFSLGLYLNFDPSHLPLLSIDPLAAVAPYVGRVVHLQAKDVEILPVGRTRFGVHGSVRRADPWDPGWYCYRLPGGSGQVDWKGLIELVAANGYRGVMSVEHEDPEWLGTTERVRAGLRRARQALLPLVAT